MKKLSLFLLTTMLSFPLYAEFNMVDFSDSEASDLQAQVSAAHSELALECEYNAMCVYNKVEELSQTGEPVYVEIFKYLQENKEEIAREHENCNTDDIKAVKKASAKCGKELMELANTTSQELNMDQINEKHVTCHINALEKLAAEGNIFAKEGMAMFSKTPEEIEKWKKAIEEHSGKPEYDVYKKCDIFGRE